MSTSGLSKEFFELIKAIGESKSKQEEDRIIQDEVRVLKSLLQDPRSGSKRMKEILVRLIYVEMLGHDASWGYVVAVQQTATSDLAQKRAGYLACSLMLSPDHEFRFMLVNQMQRDLASPNLLECSGGLVAACKLVTTEMIPALLPRVAELLANDQALVRKKAVMALHRFHQLDSGSTAHLTEQIKALLRDRDPSVMGAALCILHDMARENPSAQSDLVDQYVSILKQITEHRLPRDFDYHRMPAPWIQIKLLQLLATLGANDKRASESMYEVLGECMKRADTGTNIGFAVVYEAVKTVTSIWPDTTLLDAAANAISRFVQSEAYNLKYLGVTGLAAIVRDHPRYAVQHQMAVIDCLEDPDETLKRKTLELLFRMTNPANAEAVVAKLLTFLEQAVDPFLRADLVTRIVQLADRYAPSNLWFVETMIRLFANAGDLVDSEASQNLLRLLAEGVEPTDEDEEEAEHESAAMRKRACSLLLDAVNKPNASESLMKCAFWVLGEYGFLLSTKLNGHAKKKKEEPEDDDVIRVEEDEDEEENGDDVEFVPLDHVLEVICDSVDRTSVVDPATKAYGISAISKITAQLGTLLPRARQSMERHAMSRQTELQQRCREFLFLAADLSKLPSLFPVDASCEDFDNVDWNFLNEFSDILRAAGATEYQEHLRIVNDYDVDGGGLQGNASADISSASPGAAKVAQPKLRFDAYEPPKLYETTIQPPPVIAPTDTVSMDELSRMMASTSGISALPTAAQKPAVKSVWGPKGYMGSLPSLGGAVPQQNVSPPPAAASSPTPAAAVQTTIPPYLQTTPTLAPDYDFGASAAEEQTLEDLRPPPPPPKKPEPSEREKAAQALFGGLGPATTSKSGSSRLSKQSSSGARPSPGTQPQTKKAPQPPPTDLFSMEGDLLGVGSAITSTQSTTAPAPQASTDALMDLFSSPMPSAAPAPAPSPTIPTSPLSTLLGVMPPSPSQIAKVLGPRAMDTAYFGSLWPSHSAEARVSVRVSSMAFSDFLRTMPEKVGAKLVEFIPATQEAIFAGDATPQEIVLIHAKDRGAGMVDLMVRSRQQGISDKVAQVLRDNVF